MFVNVGYGSENSDERVCILDSSLSLHMTGKKKEEEALEVAKANTEKDS